MMHRKYKLIGYGVVLFLGIIIKQLGSPYLGTGDYKNVAGKITSSQSIVYRHFYDYKTNWKRTLWRFPKLSEFLVSASKDPSANTQLTESVYHYLVGKITYTEESNETTFIQHAKQEVSTKRYIVGEDIYDIPENLVDKFLEKYPEAREELNQEGTKQTKRFTTEDDYKLIDTELAKIVQRMIDAGESESNIALVINEYNRRNQEEKGTSNKATIRQLSNGDSPYDKYFGSGRYAETQNSVLVKASSSSDVVFILIDVSSGRKIRNEYIKRGTTFNLTKIPYGTYDYMYYSGLNWSDDYSISNSIQGGFTKNSSFTKNSYSSDRIEFKRGYYGSYEITLYEVSNGNLETKSASANEFFN